MTGGGTATGTGETTAATTAGGGTGTAETTGGGTIGAGTTGVEGDMAEEAVDTGAGIRDVFVSIPENSSYLPNSQRFSKEYHVLGPVELHVIVAYSARRRDQDALHCGKSRSCYPQF